MRCAVVSVSGFATTRDMVDTVLLLEARNVQREVFGADIVVRICFPVGVSPFLEVLEVLSFDAGSGEYLGHIVQHGGIASGELITLNGDVRSVGSV